MKEPSSQTDDYSFIRGYLFRHPVVHFAFTFCFWFTAVSLFSDFHSRFLGFWAPWSQPRCEVFALGMAIIYYAIERYCLARAFAQPALAARQVA